MNRDEAIKGCFVRCLLSLVIAALAELKIFFIEFVLVIILASAMTKFSIRKIWIILGAVLGLILGIEIITVMFPSLENWFTFESILETASSEKGYTYRNDMNRLTSVAISWNSFLDTWPRRLFGLGLGNCDYASGYDFLTTPFFRQHGLLHYIWFSSAFMILETGLIGLSVYMFFFVRVFTASHSVERNEPQKSIYCQMAKSMSVISLILIFYNSSMRMECAYMVYFVLAMPFMKKTEEDKELSTATLIKEA